MRVRDEVVDHQKMRAEMTTKSSQGWRYPVVVRIVHTERIVLQACFSSLRPRWPVSQGSFGIAAGTRWSSFQVSVSQYRPTSFPDPATQSSDCPPLVSIWTVFWLDSRLVAVSGKLVVLVWRGGSHWFQAGRGGLGPVHGDRRREHGTVVGWLGQVVVGVPRWRARQVLLALIRVLGGLMSAPGHNRPFVHRVEALHMAGSQRKRAMLFALGIVCMPRVRSCIP